MLVDAVGAFAADPAGFEAAAVRAEEQGYDGFAVPETAHDPFVSLALAARATSRITLQSAIAVAFARNPMTTAMAANDVQLVAGGRFELGLGSQVRAHIERRFGMPWCRPAARMEEARSIDEVAPPCGRSGRGSPPASGCTSRASSTGTP